MFLIILIIITNIIKRLLGQTNKSVQQTVKATMIEPRDERKAECPYCNGKLKKIPGSKTKCPHCSKFMFVRTRPGDNARVVVTEEQANKIEEEWSIVNGTHDEFLAQKKRYETERDNLKKRFGKEPSENDIKWSVLLKEKMAHFVVGDMGLYRNDILQMAEILRKEGRLKSALAYYLEICYLDLNGPENIGGVPKELRDDYPPFESKHGFLAPGIIANVKSAAKKLGLQESDIKLIYFEYCKKTCGSLKLPVALNTGWQKIEEELKK